MILGLQFFSQLDHIGAQLLKNQAINQKLTTKYFKLINKYSMSKSKKNQNN